MSHKATISYFFLFFVFLAPMIAEAELFSMVQVDSAVLIDEYAREELAREIDVGVSLTGVLGYGIDLGRVFVVPEVAGGYGWYFDPYRRGIARVMGGARLVIPGQISISLASHLGWGRAKGIDGDAVLLRSGMSYDVSLANHIDINGLVSVGYQFAYSGLVAETGSGIDVMHWVTLGLNTTIVY